MNILEMETWSFKHHSGLLWDGNQRRARHLALFSVRQGALFIGVKGYHHKYQRDPVMP